MKLNQVTLPCVDYEESVQFYLRLGFTQIVDSPPRYARFETSDGTTFSLHAAAPDSSSPEVTIYFEVEDVDQAVAELKEKGVVFDKDPTDQRWLWRESYLSDPAGNILCIYHAGENRRYPPWRIEKNQA